MKALKITVNESKCTSCRICQLVCSSLYHHEFNPTKANIIISHEYELIPTIEFSELCNNCGQCAKNCLYGALNLEGDE
jgi:ferredoxin